MRSRCASGIGAWLTTTFAWITAVSAATVVDPGQGPIALAPGAAGASELSGLAYAGADLYHAVSDSGAMLFDVDIQIDSATGLILGAAVTGSLALGAGTDLEGLVLAPLGGSVYASDEIGPAIREYRLSDGVLLSTLSVPAVFAAIRSNLSFESLAMRVAPQVGDDALWTANEEALTVDGAISSAQSGTVVRLQRFDSTLAPDGQWAYLTDPYPGAPFLGLERSGVADLLALPSGEILVLERSFSTALFRMRLYQVDLSGATDTTALASLVTDPFTPVGKTLLWERAGVLENFEGLAVGKELDAGDWSLLLVSDDGGGAPQSLYPLRLSYVPEPTAGALLAAGLLALACLGKASRRAYPAAPGGRTARHARKLAVGGRCYSRGVEPRRTESRLLPDTRRGDLLRWAVAVVLAALVTTALIGAVMHAVDGRWILEKLIRVLPLSSEPVREGDLPALRANPDAVTLGFEGTVGTLAEDRFVALESAEIVGAQANGEERRIEVEAGGKFRFEATFPDPNAVTPETKRLLIRSPGCEQRRVPVTRAWLRPRRILLECR